MNRTSLHEHNEDDCMCSSDFKKVLQGKVIAAKGGIYTCLIEQELFNCSIKGKVRRGDHGGILVGDNVDILIDGSDRSIESVRERKNSLVRPAIANVDQVLVVTTIKNPMPNFDLLDKTLVLVEKSGIYPVICVNKVDLADKDEIYNSFLAYTNAGYHVIPCSTVNKAGYDELYEILSKKTTVLSGPSGSGKSSIMNMLDSTFKLATGELSTKISRGKHTTREVKLHRFCNDAFVADTPGFSVIELGFEDEKEVQVCFPELYEHFKECRFTGCLHDKEPDCAVKKALEEGRIAKMRYDRYIEILHEARNSIKNQYR